MTDPALNTHPDWLPSREVIQRWAAHPDVMVREAFHVEPDPWQVDVLQAFPHHQRLAMKAAKGPGKTALLAWLAWNFLVTRPYPKCAATSVSGQNLADNFWTEMAKWQARNAFMKAEYIWTKSRIVARHCPETWWLSARTWPQAADAAKQADTLAGLHADYILFILDESGSIPDAVMASAEAALASCIEGHLVQAGNPTMLSGPLYRACTSEKRLWYVVEITGDPDDPKRSSRISVEWANQQIEKYGRDNPWVLVNVFGRFPPSSWNALIGPDEVEASMNRYYRPEEIGRAPKILGIDVARYGDDQSVICKRQGIQMYPLLKYRNLDSTQGAGITARVLNEWNADACFLDATGGFGSGWLDQLRLMRQTPIGVEFAGKPHDGSRYLNKRCEMYFELIQWVKDGGALPKDPDLKAGLCATTYTFHKNLLQIEDKEQIKSLTGKSPDEADACALTFAHPVGAKKVLGSVNYKAIPDDYNPFATDTRVPQYDPYR